MRAIPLLIALLLAFAAGSLAASLPPVEKEGFTSKLLIEEVVAGHLTELNGRYKLRLSETTYAPGGWIGVHHHAGPGLRYVEEGQLDYIQAGKTVVYKAGDCFYETGANQHMARNDGKTPVRLLNFELLPATWSGSSAYSVPDSLGKEEARGGR